MNLKFQLEHLTYIQEKNKTYTGQLDVMQTVIMKVWKNITSGGQISKAATVIPWSCLVYFLDESQDGQ